MIADVDGVGRRPVAAQRRPSSREMGPRRAVGRPVSQPVPTPPPVACRFSRCAARCDARIGSRWNLSTAFESGSPRAPGAAAGRHSTAADCIPVRVGGFAGARCRGTGSCKNDFAVSLLARAPCDRAGRAARWCGVRVLCRAQSRRVLGKHRIEKRLGQTPPRQQFNYSGLQSSFVSRSRRVVFRVVCLRTRLGCWQLRTA
jgi:hypothetical protein